MSCSSPKHPQQHEASTKMPTSPIMTPQMSVLGRDGRDFPLQMLPKMTLSPSCTVDPVGTGELTTICTTNDKPTTILTTAISNRIQSHSHNLSQHYRNENDSENKSNSTNKSNWWTWKNWKLPAVEEEEEQQQQQQQEEEQQQQHHPFQEEHNHHQQNHYSHDSIFDLNNPFKMKNPNHDPVNPDNDNDNDASSYKSMTMEQQPKHQNPINEIQEQDKKQASLPLKQQKQKNRSTRLFPPPASASNVFLLDDLLHPSQAYDNQTDQNPSISNSVDSSSASVEDPVISTPVKEDAVQKDCPFFYHNLEDQQYSPNTNTSNNTNAIASSATALTFPWSFSSQSTTSYGGWNTSWTQTPVPPRHRATYRARFQQLNQELHRHNNYYDDNDDDNELWLKEEDKDKNDDVEFSQFSYRFGHEDGILPNPAVLPPPSGATCVSNVSHSSLCWTHDGRILMTLPKDKVKLLMDDELEPGILSVEQSVPPSAQNQHRNKKNHHNNDNHDDNNNSAPPVLVYVLTVDETLYRRVVDEISYATTSRFGLHSFCMEEGRMDISVAVICLSVVMFLLLITTLIWPLD